MNKEPFLSIMPPVIILSNPQLGENIGAVARAMKNCGFVELRLINPRDGWPNANAKPMATHAFDVLQNASVYPDLASACFDVTQLFATSARPRELHKTVINPRVAAEKCVQNTLINISNTDAYKAAYLFGSERVGLTNDEVVFADFIVEANLNPDSKSLNLAQAVVIMCWEFFMVTGFSQTSLETQNQLSLQSKMKKEKQNKLKLPVTVEEQAYFFDRFDMLLEELGFFTTQEKAPTIKRNLRNFFIKAKLTKQDLQTWHGILTLFNKEK